MEPYHRSPSPLPGFLLHERSEHPLRPVDDTPLRQTAIPWRSFSPLLVFIVADSTSYSVIFPIITEMVTSFNVPADKIGLYSGLGEGIMMLVEAAMAGAWAKLGDRYGRRPCLLVGFLTPIIATASLGFSSSVLQLVICRAVMGLNSQGVLTKTVAAEISDSSNRDWMFSLMSPTFTLGFLVGTFLGGELSHRPFWGMENWPYALPFLTVCVFDAFAGLFGFFFLPETQKVSHNKSEGEAKQSTAIGEAFKVPTFALAVGVTCCTSIVSASPDIQYSSCRTFPGTSEGEAKQSTAIGEAFKVPTFALAVGVTCLFQLSYFSWDGIFTVFTYTSPDQGGLGLPVDIIGLLYSASSFISIVVNPLFLPRFRASMGPRQSLTLVLVAWTVLSLFIPYSNGLPYIPTFGNFAWAMTDIMTMAAFDRYPQLLATGSAITVVASAGGRAFGPTISEWLFSVSTQFPTGSTGRQTSWIYLLCSTVPGVALSRLLPRDTDETKDYEAVPLDVTEGDESNQVGS